ncbi:MAG: hypothetical protein ACI87O_002233 [Planctomycetota bacterium]
MSASRCLQNHALGAALRTIYAPTPLGDGFDSEVTSGDSDDAGDGVEAIQGLVMFVDGHAPTLLFDLQGFCMHGQ